MADIGEAFNTLKFQKKPYQTIDYFFTQRTLTEEKEYIDTNMNRNTKKVRVTNNFLALNIPTNNNKSLNFDIEIFGDEGYHYKGNIISHCGIMPSFMILINGDKKLFVNIDYKYLDNNENIEIKKLINFIDVPKRFQYIDDKIENDN
jgi:hypothetical protein